MKAKEPTLRDRLAAGPPRGLGCANEVAEQALDHLPTLKALVTAVRDGRPLVAERAANALKKVQAANPRALDPFAHALVHAALACKVLPARWNLVLVLGRLHLRARDRALVIDLLFEALAGPGAFLRTFALQALADLSAQEPALLDRLRPVLGDALAHGTAAMQARARKLLRQLDAPAFPVTKGTPR